MQFCEERKMWFILLILWITDCQNGAVEGQNVTRSDVTYFCKGKNISIDWLADSSHNINSITWSYKSPTNAIMVYSGGNIVYRADTRYESLDDKGYLVITNASLTDMGQYNISVTYTTTVDTGSDSVSVIVEEEAVGLSHTKIEEAGGTNITCTSMNQAGVYIKVNNHQYDESYHIVTSSDKVECCPKCPQNDPGTCITVQVGGDDCECKTFDIVCIVTVVLAFIFFIAFVVVYVLVEKKTILEDETVGLRKKILLVFGFIVIIVNLALFIVMIVFATKNNSTHTPAFCCASDKAGVAVDVVVLVLSIILEVWILVKYPAFGDDDRDCNSEEMHPTRSPMVRPKHLIPSTGMTRGISANFDDPNSLPSLGKKKLPSLEPIDDAVEEKPKKKKKKKKKTEEGEDTARSSGGAVEYEQE